jgi:ferredoxin
MYIPYDLIDPPHGLVPDLSDAEEDMLDYALSFKEEKSRLGCRVVLNEGLSKWSLEGEGVELPEY